jgi:hypothetical protein
MLDYTRRGSGKLPGNSALVQQKRPRCGCPVGGWPILCAQQRVGPLLLFPDSCASRAAQPLAAETNLSARSRVHPLLIALAAIHLIYCPEYPRR